MGLVDVKKRESWCENLWPGQEETGAGVVKSGPQQPWDTVASLSPLEGLAAPSLPDENTGSGAAFHWSVALVTLLAILVSRIASKVVTESFTVFSMLYYHSHDQLMQF